MANLLLSVMGAFAEFERALTLERQREGIAAAKACGVYTSRKPALTAEQAAQLRARVAGGGVESGAGQEIRRRPRNCLRVIAGRYRLGLICGLSRFKESARYLAWASLHPRLFFPRLLPLPGFSHRARTGRPVAVLASRVPIQAVRTPLNGRDVVRALNVPRHVPGIREESVGMGAAEGRDVESGACSEGGGRAGEREAGTEQRDGGQNQKAGESHCCLLRVSVRAARIMAWAGRTHA